MESSTTTAPAQASASVTTSEVNHYAWGFIGGTAAVGWLKSGEDNQDKAIRVITDELKKTEGYKELRVVDFGCNSSRTL